MAAVLCTTIGELISTSCKAVGQVICLPCRACGVGCDALSDAMNALCCSPMSPFIIFTFGLMTPAVVYGAMSIGNYGCQDLFSWLMINAVFAIIHMFGCLYIVQKLKEPGSETQMGGAAVQTATVTAMTGLEKEKVSTTTATTATATATKMEEGNYVQMSNNFSAPNEKDTGAPNSVSRAKHVLCFDKGMAVYILVILCWMAWVCVGINRRFAVDDGNDSCYELIKYMNVTITCGY
ncbi:MAG: hypothetical protein SGARI_005211, partial [Bacillariaceae sp.]